MPEPQQALRPRIIYLLNYLNMIVRRRLDERLRTHDLGGLQYTILSLVRDREGISSAELSRRFFVTPQTMNETVAGLERRGLIIRFESAANRRILEAHVTEAGRTLLQTCDHIADEVEHDAFGALPEADRHRLHALLSERFHALRAR